MELKKLHEYVVEYEMMNMAREAINKNPGIDTHAYINFGSLFNILK